ncbi:50S ribosomal protein L22 [Thermosulfuriphilus ammonigenes]|uniref:Large ribosomal subunit protein uL22 n=1 Tax=Thermosulfuriphilus ammonigenes TaxID=1936021 RepID=A0A6G7PYU4_9BACT|nr:50S ribosomal protein L22 [Thermosulfuriphilus ammonigenes]MBA2848524.1 large subunit ribosomal protein L22 [Thermosulfuriphilus ammonigenes]QIJ72832.1 50S ribosomal protein L22 [Thermosulfuriphilus ammonigenes]
MEARATAKYLRISPYKARLVADVVRGKPVGEALSILRFMPKKGARLVKKVLESAIANAEQNPQIDVDSLYIKRIYVDEGPRLKRYQPRAMGRAFPIIKRLSHITVILDEK